MFKTKLSEIMTTDLVTVDPDTTVDVIAKIFEENDFHHIPVVKKSGELVGIISKTDYMMICDRMTIFQKHYDGSSNSRFFKSLLAEEIMSKYLATAEPTDTVDFAASLFKENLFHSLPIVDDEDNLLGMITTFDLINYAFAESPAYYINK